MDKKLKLWHVSIPIGACVPMLFLASFFGNYGIALNESNKTFVKTLGGFFQGLSVFSYGMVMALVIAAIIMAIHVTVFDN